MPGKGVGGGAGPEQGEAPGGGGDQGAERARRARALALLVLGGAALMLVANPREASRDAVADPRAALGNGAALPVQSGYDDYLDELEREVALAVMQIAGVGNAVALIVPKTSEVKVLAEEVSERESEATGDGEGGARYERSVTRRPITVTGADGRGQEPVVRYTQKPEIGGALIVADGARDPRVRYLIVRAVSAALDIPPHRVEVVPKKP